MPCQFRQKVKSGHLINCGQCIECKAKRKRELVHRLLSEAKESDNVYFVTLTYNDEKIPITEMGYPTVRVKEVRDTIREIYRQDRKVKDGNKKILRKKREYSHGFLIEPTIKKCRIFGALEYGERTFRPHAHLIILNIHPYTIERIQETWGRGNVQIEIPRNTNKALEYVCKYTIKGDAQIQGDMEEAQLIIPKQLGKIYADKFKTYHKRHLTNKSVYSDTLPIGRYLSDKIFNAHEKEIIKQKTLKEAEAWEKKNIEYLEKTGHGCGITTIEQIQEEKRKKLLKKAKSERV